MLEVTLLLRPQGGLPEPGDPRWSLLPHLRPAAEAPATAAAPGDLDRVAAFARAEGLEVVRASQRRRQVAVRGTARQMQDAFGVALRRYQHPGGRYRGHDGHVHVPDELHGIVQAVVGLHDCPPAGRPSAGRPGIARARGGRAPARAAPAAAVDRMFPATRLSDLYRFPRGLGGAGQRVGLIELSTPEQPCGYDPADLEHFLRSLTLPWTSRIRPVVLPGAVNQAEDRGDVGAYLEWMNRALADPAAATAPPQRGKATVEVVMDIELAAALAPEAEIVVYFTPNTEQGVLHALQEIAHDPEGPTVVSLSWSWEERGDAVEKQIDAVLAESAHRITFCVASGDHGGSRICFPAASPWVLACGGTSLAASTAGTASETVWNNTPLFPFASGGGASAKSPRPAWQREVTPPGPGRGLPDVAAMGDPATHCRIFAGGTWGPASGTSAAAPIWAALVACINQGLGRPLGYLTPLLYGAVRRVPGAFRDVVEGNNRVGGVGSAAAVGWDACTGWGVPVGERLLAALRGDAT